MKKMVLALVLSALLLGTLACAKAGAPSTAEDGGIAPPAPQAQGGPAPRTTTAAPAPTKAPAPIITQVPAPTITIPGMASADQSIDRMIVRTGSLTMLVEDVAGNVDKINKLAESLKGYVVSSRTWKENERLVGAVSIRVPSETFTQAMQSIRDLAVEVTSDTTSARDVTEEYVDLTARLKNLEAAEQQMVKLLGQATKIEDILAIQRELTNLRGQIEQTRGRMQYLERTSSTSIIDVRLEQASVTVKFTANKVRVDTGEQVRFNAQVSGGFAPYSYEWDFGDGQTANTASLTHAYRAAGSYTVKLTVTDDRKNSDVETREQYITVESGWSAGGVAGSAVNGLVVFGQALGNVLIWLGIFSPVWLVALAIVYLVRRRRNRR